VEPGSPLGQWCRSCTSAASNGAHTQSCWPEEHPHVAYRDTGSICQTSQTVAASFRARRCLRTTLRIPLSECREEEPDWPVGVGFDKGERGECATICVSASGARNMHVSTPPTENFSNLHHVFSSRAMPTIPCHPPTHPPVHLVTHHRTRPYATYHATTSHATSTDQACSRVDVVTSRRHNARAHIEQSMHTSAQRKPRNVQLHKQLADEWLHCNMA
jgi:hypothetical protein